jgi:hypothetical protein
VHRAALLAALVALPTVAAEKTLWLVRPLYPGQEALAGRTEQSIDKLTPPEQRANHVIGHKELAVALTGKKAVELPCFNGETRCADPIDPFMAGLGFDRVVLIQGGQDESGFKFKVVSYEPATGKVTPASATDANLDNALLGAIAKVVPVTSTMDVTSLPPGATVYVDERKIGVTPIFGAQVLPGERTVRIDLKLHQIIEEPIIVPMRGSVKIDKSLEKVAARISITAAPPGTSISLDGVVLGKDRIDRGVQPGAHTIRLTADKYKAFEQSIQVKADEQFSLDKTLEPIAGPVTAPPQTVYVVKPPPPQPPPPPLSLQDQLYARKSYFLVGFDYTTLRGSYLDGTRFGSNGRSTGIDSPSRSLYGATAEFGFFGNNYFGLAAFGATVAVPDRTWSMRVGYNASSGGCETDMSGACKPSPINAKVLLATIRLIQPQFRVQLWRFMLQLQGGLELRLGQISEAVTNSTYDGGGFFILDLLVGFRAGFRFYIVDGLFLFAQYKWSWCFWSPLVQAIDTTGRTTNVPPSASEQGFHGGLGYAF